MVLGWGKKPVVQEEKEEEMSMEDILASIRKYVSEDSQEEEQKEIQENDKDRDEDETFVLDPRKNSESISSPQFNPRQAPQFEPRNTFEATLENEFDINQQSEMCRAEDYRPEDLGGMYIPELSSLSKEHLNEKPIFRSMVTEKQLEHSVDQGSVQFSKENAQRIIPQIAKQEEDKSIMSESTASMASKSFSKLIDLSRISQSQEISRASTQNAPVTLDQLIAELARPMIQDWVDKNLPTLVEQMVSAEINKITQRLGLK